MSVMIPLPIEIGTGPLLLAGQYQQAVRSTAAAGGAAPDVAALLCNPFGQEAIRCHRAFRMLAGKLARIGVPNLRFDYYATGESPGDDGQGDLSRWCRDVVLAHEELAARSGARAIAWIGLRLGAAIALAAAPKASRPPASVVLWDPVVAGSGYLEELSGHHAFWTRRRGVTSEVLGFRLPARLRTQIAAFDLPAALAEALTASPIEVDIMMGEDHGESRDGRLQDRLLECGSRVRCVTTGDAIAWCSNEAHGSRWVPTESLSRLVALVTDGARRGEGARMAAAEVHE
jgi:uncharacterized protein